MPGRGIPRFLVTVVLSLAAVTAQAQAGAPRIGDIVDTFNGVPVYYNGAIGHVSGVNRAADGYVFGLRYQCVEFIKRYYYQRFGHRMPKPGGNARDYFDPDVADGALNPARGLLQYRNGSTQAPQLDDILLFGPWPGNPYGHLAIVTDVEATSIEIIQQNPGPNGHSRRRFPLVVGDKGVRVDQRRVVGWLHLPGRPAQAIPKPQLPTTPVAPEPALPSPLESVLAPVAIPSANPP
ncbi:MAG: CHAP domain-containing protein [Rhizobium sp.]|nr:MAG: CHAP domain-containing protein [Rhizobium sp.]